MKDDERQDSRPTKDGTWRFVRKKRGVICQSIGVIWCIGSVCWVHCGPCVCVCVPAWLGGGGRPAPSPRHSRAFWRGNTVTPNAAGQHERGERAGSYISVLCCLVEFSFFCKETQVTNAQWRNKLLLCWLFISNKQCPCIHGVLMT